MQSSSVNEWTDDLSIKVYQVQPGCSDPLDSASRNKITLQIVWVRSGSLSIRFNSEMVHLQKDDVCFTRAEYI